MWVACGGIFISAGGNATGNWVEGFLPRCEGILRGSAFCALLRRISFSCPQSKRSFLLILLQNVLEFGKIWPQSDATALELLQAKLCFILNFIQPPIQFALQSLSSSVWQRQTAMWLCGISRKRSDRRICSERIKSSQSLNSLCITVRQAEMLSL
jgi:hypothetical protein